jgi:hypothetical protein
MTKRNSVYILGNLTQKQLETFKNELLGYCITTALKIKNLNLSEKEIEQVANHSISLVLLTYNSTTGNPLGDAVKTQFLADLRQEYTKRYPNKPNDIMWPDLIERKAAKRLLELVQKIQGLSSVQINDILEIVDNLLSQRQLELLSTLMKQEKGFTFSGFADSYQVSASIISRDIKTIYRILKQTIKGLGIDIS